IDPRNMRDVYNLAVADLQMSPIDPKGFWYCGKAISIALQNKEDVRSMSFVCKLKFRDHGGKLEEWDRLVSSTKKDTAPPQDFVKGLSLQEPNQALPGPNPASGGAAQPLAHEPGDPLAKSIVPAAAAEYAIGAGIGSSLAAVMAPDERPR